MKKYLISDSQKQAICQLVLASGKSKAAFYREDLSAALISAGVATPCPSLSLFYAWCREFAASDGSKSQEPQAICPQPLSGARLPAHSRPADFCHACLPASTAIADRSSLPCPDELQPWCPSVLTQHPSVICAGSTAYIPSAGGQGFELFRNRPRYGTSQAELLVLPLLGVILVAEVAHVD